jgi:hypothetical protein
MNIEDIFKTAHIRPETATLRVTVDDVMKYEALWNPRCTQIEEDVVEEDPDWKKEMGIPDFVNHFAPWGLPASRDDEDDTNVGEEWKGYQTVPEEQCLIVFVCYPYDLVELADFLGRFE